MPVLHFECSDSIDICILVYSKLNEYYLLPIESIHELKFNTYIILPMKIDAQF